MGVDDAIVELELKRQIGFLAESKPQATLTVTAHAKMPTFAQVSLALNKLVVERDGEWAGFPMPLPGAGLVLEDKSPHVEAVRQIEEALNPPVDHACSPDIMGWREINRWRGHTKDGVWGLFVIFRHEDGRTRWGFDPDTPKRNHMLFGPFDTFEAWNVDTEITAIERLSTLLSERMFKAYLLTGGFLERSKRSGISYFFRRCRPTIAIRTGKSRTRFFYEDDEVTDEATILCTLCLHPLGYYRNTFGGAMTPTDDVIAHLLLMRGDEHMLWRRANQHQAAEPESGL